MENTSDKAERAKKIVHDMFKAYNNSDKAKAENQVRDRMGIAAKKSEYEEHLNKMWDNYRRGNTHQVVAYQEQLDYIKSAGFKVYRNSQGIHKIVIN